MVESRTAFAGAWGAAALCLALSGPATAATVAPDMDDHHHDYLAAGEFVFGPTTPGKWGDPTPGTGATITYSYMPSGPSCAVPVFEPAGCSIVSLASFMPVGFQAAIEAAFNAWAAVANLTFIEVPDDGAPLNGFTSSGDIRLGGHVFDGPGGTLAHGYYPPNNGTSAAGDIHFDSEDEWVLGFGSGSGFDIFQVAAHEIGHALGLDHTDVAGSLMNTFYTEAFSGPQADDIAGIQALYGPPAPVPLPAGVWLGLAGFGALSGLRFVRRPAPARAPATA